VDYSNFRKQALGLAEEKGWLYEEDNQTGDIILSGDGEGWIGVRSADRATIDKVIDDDGSTHSPLSWLLNQEPA